MKKTQRRTVPQLFTGLHPPSFHQLAAHDLERLAFIKNVATDLKISGENWLFELAYAACVELYGTTKERGRRPSIKKYQLTGPIQVWKRMRDKGFSPAQISRLFVYFEPFSSDTRRRLRDPETKKTALTGAPDRIRKIFKKYGCS